MLGGPDGHPSNDRLPEVADWGEGERLAGEKESLGFFITGHPLERYRLELEQMATVTTARLPEMADREVSVGGIVTALRLIKTRKGDRMASFVLEDMQGGVEALVFPQTYKEVAGRLAEDEIVLVKGKAETLDEGKARLLVSDIQPIDRARHGSARAVTIRVALARWDRGKGERLRDILGSHRGDCPVTLELFQPEGLSVAV